MPPDTGRFRELNQWMPSGARSQQAYALVLTARHDGSRLFDLFERFGEDIFKRACQEASELLKTMAADSTCGDVSKRLRREAAALELLIHLGANAAPSLMPAVALCKIEKPMGYRADGAYRAHQIPKKNGGERLISVPHPALRRSQRFILDRLLTSLGFQDCAFGFVPGRSIADNAKPHVGQPVVVNADIRNCFPSVRMHLVREVLQNRLGSVISADAIELLLDLTTTRAALPVGAPTSPALLNLVLFQVDECLQRRAEQLGGRYTRYADDLTFSGGPQVIGLLRLAQREIGRLRLELDPAKTNIFRRGRRQMVTGLGVNDKVAVPREIRRRLRAAVHHMEKNTDMHWNGQSQSIEELRGRLAFVAMACKYQATPLINRLEQACAMRLEMAPTPHSKKGCR
jgi:retron-type reverse transcriptase